MIINKPEKFVFFLGLISKISEYSSEEHNTLIHPSRKTSQRIFMDFLFKRSMGVIQNHVHFPLKKATKVAGRGSGFWGLWQVISINSFMQYLISLY